MAHDTCFQDGKNGRFDPAGCAWAFARSHVQCVCTRERADDIGNDSRRGQQALTEAGMSSVQIEDVASGAPVFRADMGEVLFFVRALDCAENACSTLMFFANFELGRNAVSTDYSIVNQYNERQVFGRAYVIDERGEVGVDYVIELGGGVSKENVAVNISTWGDVINAFREHFRSRAAGS